MIRLAIVEDHPAIAEGLTALLRGEPDVTVVGTAGDCDAADRLIAAQAPDIVLCDIRLSGTMDGLDLLARHTPGPAFIMLSAYSYPSYYVAAVEHGARGYLSKMAAIGQILTAVRTVAAGDTAFPDDVKRAVRTALRPPTPRERSIRRTVLPAVTSALAQESPATPAPTTSTSEITRTPCHLLVRLGRRIVAPFAICPVQTTDSN